MFQSPFAQPGDRAFAVRGPWPPKIKVAHQRGQTAQVVGIGLEVLGADGPSWARIV